MPRLKNTHVQTLLKTISTWTSIGVYMVCYIYVFQGPFFPVTHQVCIDCSAAAHEYASHMSGIFCLLRPPRSGQQSCISTRASRCRISLPSCSEQIHITVPCDLIPAPIARQQGSSFPATSPRCRSGVTAIYDPQKCFEGSSHKCATTARYQM